MIFYEYKNLFNRTSDVKDIRLGQVVMNEKWQWISMVDRLSGGDITKHEDVFKMNYIYCLNVLSFYHERDLYNSSISDINRKI